MLSVVLVYAMLFMEWDERGSPFDEVRLGFLGLFYTRKELLTG